MQLQQAVRTQIRIRMALEGPSGSGKTYSALLLAYGLCGSWEKIALIDTEEATASLYSHLGAFSTVQLGTPFHPARFYDAIDLCDTSGKQVIIVDSISPEWVGEGGVIDRLSGKHYEDVLRSHRAFLTALRHTEAHIICTVRTRQKLARVGSKPGKRHWQLMQLPVQQEGIEYNFDTVLRLDKFHNAHVVKDRTMAFSSKPASPLTMETGELLSAWCNKGRPVVPQELQEQIDSCKSVSELYQVLFKSEIEDPELISSFAQRWVELEQEPNQQVQLERIRGGLL